MRLKKLNNKQVIKTTTIDRKAKNKPRQAVAILRLRDDKGRLVSKQEIEKKMEEVRFNFSKLGALLSQMKNDRYAGL